MNLHAILLAGPDGGSLPAVRALLAAFPWAWPADGTAAAHAAEATGAGEPSPPPIGHAPLLADHAGEGVAWLCAVRRLPAGLHPGAVASEVTTGLPRLRAEVGRHLPVHPASAPLTFCSIDATDSAVARLPPLKGPSLDLGVALALASDGLNRPVRGDVVASATIREAGWLGHVGGWEAKARAVVTLMPAVTEVIVAPPDEDVAVAALARAGGAGRARVVVCGTLADALREAFGCDALSAAVRDAQPDQRTSLVGRFFRDALEGTSTFVRWGPALDLIGAALGWPDLHDDDRDRLLFARAVAARYARLPTDPGLPAAEWLRALCGATQMEVLAHVFQHFLRWGGQPPDIALLAVGTARAMGDWGPCLKLRGAWARWADGHGHHVEALEEHRDVVDAWVRMLAEREASYSLAERLRLEGSLGDASGFVDAVRLMDRVERDGAFGQTESMYLRTARAQGAWALGLDGDSERWHRQARQDLEWILALGPDVPNRARVQRVAWRYLLYLDPEATEPRRSLEADRGDGTDLALVDLRADPHTDLDSWAGRLPTHHRWRAGVLIGQRRDPLHVLRFFVDA